MIGLFVFASVCLAVTLPIPALMAKGRAEGHERAVEAFYKEFGRPENEEAQEFTFQQRLDHFAVTAETQGRVFSQRYWINDTYYDSKKGGPLFVQLGEEARASASLVNGMAMTQYGERAGALLLAIEHRGYGGSHFASDMSTENMRFLSVDQGLQDFAAVIEYVKGKYMTAETPVVVFGCSYIGAGASWARTRISSHIAGAVASSPPVQAVVDFTKYLDQVDKDLSSFFGPTCDAALRNATSRIADMLATSSGQTEVEKLFGVCKPMQGVKDQQTFWSAVIGSPWMGATQYYSEGAYPTVKQLCAELTASSDPLESFVALSRQFNNNPCLDASYADSVNFLRNTAWDSAASDSRSWLWQCASQFAYYQSTDSPRQPFGSGMPLQYYLDMNKDVYGLHFDIYGNINNTNSKFGGQNLPSYVNTNVAYAGTRYGVWQTLAPQKSVNPSSPLFLYESEGHCGSVFPLTSKTPNDIRQVHEQVYSELLKWIKL